MPRSALFDLAIERALSYSKKLGLIGAKEIKRIDELEIWYLKTRFAYRIPFYDIQNVLKTCPNDQAVWRGGKNGKWVVTKTNNKQRQTDQ